MAVTTLTISGYQVTFNNELTTAGTITRNRFIHLTPDASKSKIDEITLAFTNFSEVNTIVGKLIKQTDSTFFLSILLPVPEFPMYYDLVRGENPLTLQIEYSGLLQVNVPIPLKSFNLSTKTEPLGEGPADASV